MSMRAVTILCLLVLTAACGGERSVARDGSAGDQPASPGPLVLVDGEVQVSCGGDDGWSPSTMADGVPDVMTDAEAVQGFRAMLADPRLGEELRLSRVFPDDPAETDWRVLTGDDSGVVLGLGRWTADGPPRDGVTSMTVGPEDGEWRLTGMGECQLAPLLDDGSAWVDVSAPDGGLDRTTTEPTVDVTERECASGRDPSEFLHDPHVVETDESVTVYWTSEPPRGAGNCMGSLPVEETLSLDEPLGDRELLDGSVYPPRTVGQH